MMALWGVGSAAHCQQYVSEFPVEFPADVISDTHLDLLRSECCPPSYTSPQYAGPAMALSAGGEPWSWQVLPADVLWQSYWAGAKESRISSVVFEEPGNNVSLMDVSLGGRAAILRHGTAGPAASGRIEGWELQIEGAGMLRLNLDENWDLEAVDFRFGVPLVYGRDQWQWKFAYYHLSAHLGDERIIRTGSVAERINYSRDALVVAFSYFPLPAWRWYAEAEWAFYADAGAKPWAFQFGLDFAQPGPTNMRGTPFLALNGHLRQEVDFGGNLVVQTGWLWRGQSNRVLRAGLHYQNGKSNQFTFFNQFEQQVGLGLWYDY